MQTESGMSNSPFHVRQGVSAGSAGTLWRANMDVQDDGPIGGLLAVMLALILMLII